MSANISILHLQSEEDAVRILEEIGTTQSGINIMKKKMIFRVIKLEKVDTRAANILKQTMLSKGAEAAVSRGTVNLSVPYTDVIIGATLHQLRQAIPRLKQQPWGLKEIAEKLDSLCHI